MADVANGSVQGKAAVEVVDGTEGPETVAEITPTAVATTEAQIRNLI